MATVPFDLTEHFHDPDGKSGASHRPCGRRSHGRNPVVSQELPTGPRPAWSWEKLG